MPKVVKSSSGKLKVGMKVKVIGQTAGHGLAIGIVGTIASFQAPNYVRLKEYPAVVLYEVDVAPAVLNKKEIAKSIRDKETEIAVLKETLTALEAAGKDEVPITILDYYSALLKVEKIKQEKGDLNLYQVAYALSEFMD